MCKKKNINHIDGEVGKMDKVKCDNVFSANVSETVVEIKVGYCEQDVLDKGEISSSDVQNVKEIRIAANDYINFLRVFTSLGIQLQEEFGIDLGFEKEEV